MPLSSLSTSGGRRTLAVLCCLVLFLFAVYLGAIGILLPALGKTFGLGPAVEGRIFPANFGGFVIAVLACGVLSDKIGRRRVLLGAIFVYAVALGLAGFARSFGTVLAAFALIGAGGGAMETVASALAADLFPQKRAAILNALQVAFGAGAVVSPLLAHKLLTLGTDWHRLFLGVALANLVLLALMARQQVPAPAHPAEALDRAAPLAVLRQPAFLVLCGCQALYVGAETGFSSWLPSYFGHLPGGAAWAGIVVSGFWVTMTVGRAAVGGGVFGLPLTRLACGLALGGAAASGCDAADGERSPCPGLRFGNGLVFFRHLWAGSGGGREPVSKFFGNSLRRGCRGWWGRRRGSAVGGGNADWDGVGLARGAGAGSGIRAGAGPAAAFGKAAFVARTGTRCFFSAFVQYAIYKDAGCRKRFRRYWCGRAAREHFASRTSRTDVRPEVRHWGGWAFNGLAGHGCGVSDADV